MAKKDKAGKGKNKKSEVKVYEASAVMAVALKDAEKAGEREYKFKTPNSKELSVFKVKGSKATAPKTGTPCIRKGYMINGKQVTAQAAKMLLFQVGIACDETPEKKVAQTVASLKAATAWQEKHGFLVDPPKEEKSAKTEKAEKPAKAVKFKKKEMKIEIKKKDVKKGFGESLSKKNLKIVLKSFGNEKKIALNDLVVALDGVVKEGDSGMSTNEIKAAIPSYF